MNELAWKCEVDIRIAHPQLDPTELTRLLDITPSVAQCPGESRVPYGECRSAGYWCATHVTNFPERPDAAMTWAEQFVATREQQIRELMNKQFDVNIYAAIYLNVMTVGFVFPSVPAISRLNIPIGIEIFTS